MSAPAKAKAAKSLYTLDSGGISGLGLRALRVSRSKKHHFIPVFYLKAWASQENPKLVHAYDLKAGVLRHNIGLRDQGQEKLYHQDAGTEHQFEWMDGKFSKACRQVRTSGCLPDYRAWEHAEFYLDLWAFVITQHARVPSSAEDYRDFIETDFAHMVNLMFGEPDEEVEIRQPFPQLASVQHLVHSALLLADDLTPHLIVSDRDCFLTSDNPAFFYNQLNQGIPDATAAPDNHGFQAFVPISPRIVLVFFDSGSYELTSPAAKATRKSAPTESDIRQLNRMQLLAAEQNVYAGARELLDAVPCILASVEDLRALPKVQRLEGHSVDEGPETKLFVSHREVRNLSLDLSCIRTKWSASSRSSQWRLHTYRHDQSNGVNGATKAMREGKPVRIFEDQDGGLHTIKRPRTS